MRKLKPRYCVFFFRRDGEKLIADDCRVVCPICMGPVKGKLIRRHLKEVHHHG